MTIKIDKDVPIPFPTKGIYPWEQMAVGDSFFVEKRTPQNFNMTGTNNRFPDKKFIVRPVDGGVRVWRVK